MPDAGLKQARAAETRRDILATAAALFHRQGYAATGLDELVAACRLTKGAFYYHFRSKKAVARAVIDEVVAAQVRARMITPVAEAARPLEAIRRALARLREEVPAAELVTGCPVNNLASELALLDAELQGALAALFDEWERAWTKALRRDLGGGALGPFHDARELSVYLIAAVEGAQALAKAQQSRRPIDLVLKQLERLTARV